VLYYICGFITGRNKKQFLLPKFSDRLWIPDSLPFCGYRGYFPGIKWPELEVDNSLAYSAEVNNEWNYASKLHVCLYVVNREIFALIFKFTFL